MNSDTRNEWGRKEERGVGKWKMELEVPSVATTYIKSITQLNPLFHLDRDIFVVTLKPFLYGRENYSKSQHTPVYYST